MKISHWYGFISRLFIIIDRLWKGNKSIFRAAISWTGFCTIQTKYRKYDILIKRFYFTQSSLDEECSQIERDIYAFLTWFMNQSGRSIGIIWNHNMLLWSTFLGIIRLFHEPRTIHLKVPSNNISTISFERFPSMCNPIKWLQKHGGCKAVQLQANDIEFHRTTGSLHLN